MLAQLKECIDSIAMNALIITGIGLLNVQSLVFHFLQLFFASEIIYITERQKCLVKDRKGNE